MDHKILEHIKMNNKNDTGGNASSIKLGKKNSLTLLTSITASFGFIMLCVSVTTDSWLTTFERERRENGSFIYAIRSGLWKKCESHYFMLEVDDKTLWDYKLKTVPVDPPPNCSNIAYFSGKPKGLAEVKPPVAILYDMQPAAFFPATGLVGLLSGCILSFLSNCDHKVKKLIFVGGGLFVLSGIFLLVGIVLYVGSISQAFDGTLGNAESENKYSYDYGNSFYFSVIAFILTEFSGIFAIYLYIAKHRHYLRIKREAFMARSQSVNSCIGLVPSNSRFSFDGGTQSQIPKHKRNNISIPTGKTGLTTSLSRDLLDTATLSHKNSISTNSQQWLLTNSYSKATINSELNGESHEKLLSSVNLIQPLNNGPSNLPIIQNLPTGINNINKPNSKFIKSLQSNTSSTLPPNCIQFYDDEEIGETSFGYNPRQQQLIDTSGLNTSGLNTSGLNTSGLNTNGPNRAFYDTSGSGFYVTPHQNYIISPEHSIISAAHNHQNHHHPQHHNNQSKIAAATTNIDNVIHSPLGNLKNIHILTSLDDDDALSSSHASQKCNCAQPDNSGNQLATTLTNNNNPSVHNLSTVSSPIPSNYMVPQHHPQYSSSSSQLQLSATSTNQPPPQLPINDILPVHKNQTTPNTGSSRKITSV